MGLLAAVVGAALIVERWGTWRGIVRRVEEAAAAAAGGMVVAEEGEGTVLTAEDLVILLGNAQIAAAELSGVKGLNMQNVIDHILLALLLSWLLATFILMVC